MSLSENTIAVYESWKYCKPLLKMPSTHVSRPPFKTFLLTWINHNVYSAYLPVIGHSGFSTRDENSLFFIFTRPLKKTFFFLIMIKILLLIQ